MNITSVQDQWRNRPADERFESLIDLKASVDNRLRESHQYDVDTDKLVVLSDEKNITLLSKDSNVPAIPYNLSHYAFGQLSTLAGAPAAFLRRLPSQEVANIFNYLLPRERAERGLKMLTREYEDPFSGGDSGLSRSFTSQSYGRIWDADCVDAVMRIVEATEGKFYNPKEWSGKAGGLYSSDHDVFMFLIDGGSIVDGGGERDQLNRGFYVWNSETGARTFGISTFLFRIVCGNYMIWDAQDVMTLKIRHTSGGPERFVSDAVPALKEFSQTSVSTAEAIIRAAKVRELPLREEDRIDMFVKLKITRGEVRRAIEVAEREEGKCSTLWDFVNGLTAYARTFAHEDSKIDLERRAGSLLKLVA